MTTDAVGSTRTAITALASAVALAGLLSAVPGAARAESDRTWWSGTLVAGTGFEYSTGDYGDGETRDTEIWDVPFSVKYIFEEIGFWPLDEVELKASIPYRRIREPDPDGGRESREGIGDLSLRLGYFRVPRKKIWPIVGALARVRLQTATDDVGTDATDVFVALDVSNSYELGDGRYPRITPFARATYRVAGDPGSDGQPTDGGVDAGSDRDRFDTWQTSVGLTFRPIWDIGIGLAYDWGESASKDGDSHELSPFLSWRVTRNFRIGPYAVFGLSDDSVDYAAGLALRMSFDIEGRRDVPIRAGGER